MKIENDFLKKKIPATVRERAVLIDAEYKKLSVKKQCKLLGISRTAYYYSSNNEQQNRDISDLKLIMNILQEIPFYGYRKISRKQLFRTYRYECKESGKL